MRILAKAILTRFRMMVRFLNNDYVVYNISMKKNKLSLCCIIFACVCQVAMGLAVVGRVQAEETSEAIPETKLKMVANKCDSIKEILKGIQKSDSRARVYLGAHYETILTKYITALNVRLVENSISDVALIENQNSYAKAKTAFSTDFVNYQKDLEELIQVDCKAEPKVFYNELVGVRKKREVMVNDMVKLADLLSQHKKLVKKLEERL